MYGSVVSSEDHGYVVTLGLEGVTAFLPLADAPKGGLELGQPVEAVIQVRGTIDSISTEKKMSYSSSLKCVPLNVARLGFQWRHSPCIFVACFLFFWCLYTYININKSIEGGEQRFC